MQYKIGFLLPQSNNYAVQRDFLTGFKMAMSSNPSLEWKAFVESTVFGLRKVVVEKYNKLYLQENVDLVVGISQWRAYLESAQMFEQNRVPVLFNEIGANLPLPQPASSHIYTNSLNLWQSSYALGKYLREQGHQKLLMVSHYYDGGYGTPFALFKGFESPTTQVAIPFMVQDSFGTQELTQLEQYIQQQGVDAVCISLSNPRHLHLLDFLSSSTIAGKVQIVANPHWIDDDVLEKHPNAKTAGIHSVNTWNRRLKNPINQQLVADYEEEEEEIISPFVLLGYETGSLVAQAHKALGDKWAKRKSLKSFLLEAKLEGPRNGYHFHPNLQCSFSQHHLQKVEITSNGIENTIVQEVHDLQDSMELIQLYHQSMSTGWDNPYLCV